MPSLEQRIAALEALHMVWPEPFDYVGEFGLTKAQVGESVRVIVEGLRYGTLRRFSSPMYSHAIESEFIPAPYAAQAPEHYSKAERAAFFRLAERLKEVQERC